VLYNKKRVRFTHTKKTKIAQTFSWDNNKKSGINKMQKSIFNIQIFQVEGKYATKTTKITWNPPKSRNQTQIGKQT